MPSSGPLVLKWAIQIADDLITRMITGKITPANYELENTLVHTGSVLIARYVKAAGKYVSEEIVGLEKLANYFVDNSTDVIGLDPPAPEML